MTQTHVLGIACSPRRGGNSETLLDRFLDGACSAGAEVEKLVVARLHLQECVSCEECYEEGVICPVEDDFAEVNRKLIAADVIAFAVPLYFLHMPARAKALIDRGQSQWSRKYVRDDPLEPTATGRDRRRGVLICVGGSPHPDFHGVIQTMKSYFDVYETDYWEQLLCRSVDAHGAVKERPDMLQAAFELGVQTAA
jgi:multimeric flavodoxin WrbA